MNEDIEAIKYFKECILKDHTFEEILTIAYMKDALSLIEKQQAEKEKKDKIIDLLLHELEKQDEGSSASQILERIERKIKEDK